MSIKYRFLVPLMLVPAFTANAAPLTNEGMLAFNKQWGSTRGLVQTAFNDVAYSGFLFVTVGESGAIFSSKEGVIWKRQESGTTENLNKVQWIEDQFFAVGHGGIILSSTDLVIWDTRRKQQSGRQQLNSIAYNGEVYVAIGAKTLNYTNGALILTSPDGAVWTEAGAPSTLGPLMDVVWVQDKFVAAGQKGHLSSDLAWSYDGISWNTVNSGEYSQSIGYLVWDGETIMATGISSYGPDYRFSQMLSDDGIEWYQPSPRSDRFVDQVKYFNGYYYSIGLQSSTGWARGDGEKVWDTLFVSSDGIKWDVVRHDSSFQMRAMAWSDTRFVVVCNRGSVLSNQFSVGSILPADGVGAGFLAGLGYYYDGFFPFVWSWAELEWLWIARESASLEGGFYFWHFGRSSWCWSMASIFPWYVEFDGSEGIYREFGMLR